MAFTQPLDLYEILVNQLAGDMAIFTFLALLTITILGAKFKMPNLVLAGMILVFVVLVGASSNIGAGSELRGLLLLGSTVLAIMLGITLTKIANR